MSMMNPNVKEQVIYQAEQPAAQTMRQVRDKLHSVIRPHIHRYVRIQTIDGHIVEGTIVHCDMGILYIYVSPPMGHHRQFYNPLILPLVLYELLVITLLYT